MKVFAFFLIFLFLQLNNWAEAQANRYDREEVTQVLCFSQDMDSGMTFFSNVCHVGVEVKTKSGNKYTIHNLGPEGADTKVEPIGETCDPERYRSQKWHVQGVTVGKLREKGGANYKLFRNNCYDARNRMLDYLGLNFFNCPNVSVLQALRCVSLDNFKNTNRCL